MLLLGKFEVSPNFEYLLTLPGFMKILEIVFCVIGLGLGLHALHDSKAAWKEEFFRSSLLPIIIVSSAYLIAHCLSDDLVTNRHNRLIDVLLHAVAGVDLIVAGSLIISSDIEIQINRGENLRISYEHNDLKIGAGVFALADGILYFVTGVIVFKIKAL